MATRANTARYDLGKIKHGGAGGFLNPPTHPEHSLHVMSTYGDTFFMSLSSAVDEEWLDDETRDEARRILKAWNPLPLDHEDVKAWIYQVLGYFRNCYKGEGPKPWNVSNLRMRPKLDPMRFITWILHAGVHFIRQYYPHYKPTENDFANAKWG